MGLQRVGHDRATFIRKRKPSKSKEEGMSEEAGRKLGKLRVSKKKCFIHLINICSESMQHQALLQAQ